MFLTKVAQNYISLKKLTGHIAISMYHRRGARELQRFPFFKYYNALK